MSINDPTITAELLVVRQHGGYLPLSNFSIIELSGADAESFLQGRSSNDVKALQDGTGQLSSLLDRKGYLIAFITVHRLQKNKYWILSESEQSACILQQFSTYHFREQISYRQIGDKFNAVALQGPRSESFLQSFLDKRLAPEEYSIAELKLFDTQCTIVTRSISGDSGYLVFADKTAGDAFMNEFAARASEKDIQKILPDTLDALRIEAGHPVFGRDISQEHLLPETGLEQSAASYNKGCFQGQEVLARIKTYGAPKRALVGLIFDEQPSAEIPLDTTFTINGEESGCIKSNVFSPSLNAYIALAYIARDFRVPDRKTEIETAQGKFKVTVKFLPFYSAGSSKARAKQLYESALLEFAKGSEEAAIKSLREVIELDPLFADAYESLGVILSRHEQYDEAIALMHRLQSLDPQSIMAHTNLSIYYMHLGDKERAEEEKAIAMSIRMSMLAREHAQKKKEEADQQKLAAEAEQRLAMFRQVLQIDPHDFLANNGVGTVYVELGKYEEAIPYLLKAIEVKPTHTVAYLALGKAFEQLDRITDAIKVYKSGIDIAAKRGDITPMKEMQALLAGVEAKAQVL